MKFSLCPREKRRDNYRPEDRERERERDHTYLISRGNVIILSSHVRVSMC